MEKDELDDHDNVKDEPQEEDQDEPMDEESFDEADRGDPEAAEIREMRNRLETFDSVSHTVLIFCFGFFRGWLLQVESISNTEKIPILSGKLWLPKIDVWW